jgi:hypothetical protein
VGQPISVRELTGDCAWLITIDKADDIDSEIGHQLILAAWSIDGRFPTVGFSESARAEVADTAVFREHSGKI